jgi:hypothetical protein
LFFDGGVTFLLRELIEVAGIAFFHDEYLLFYNSLESEDKTDVFNNMVSQIINNIFYCSGEINLWLTMDSSWPLMALVWRWYEVGMAYPMASHGFRMTNAGALYE